MKHEYKPTLAYVRRGHIDEIRALRDEEYLEVLAASDYIQTHSLHGWPYLMVTQNYSEYIDSLCLPKIAGVSDLNEVVLNLNRRINNLLSSVRTYIDHSEYNLSKRCGKNSIQLKEFKAGCSAAYDKSFAYRFTYKLRNFAQHCGLPIGNLKSTSRLISHSSKKTTHNLELTFNRDELLKKFDSWSKKVEQEIITLPEFFDINPLLDEMMNQLEKIEFIRMKIEHLELYKKALAIKTLLDEHTIENEPPVIIESFQKNTSNTVNVTVKELPIHLIEKIISEHEKFAC